MNPEAAPSQSQFSQFQLIGGMKHDPADTFLLIEPGGGAQQRKGALYLAAEAAGEPALGGEVAQLALSNVAREYFDDNQITVTSALTEALNRANQSLIHFNRQSLQANVPAGLPRKNRVGMTAAVARGGVLYLCQLRPSFAIFVDGGEPDMFPRPRHWPEETPRLSSEGVLVPNLYQAASLGSGLLVEADFTHRRISPDSLLVLCSSNIAPLLDPVESREWLAGRSASAVIEYLYNLARSHNLAEAHAVAIDALGGDGKRSTGTIYVDPPAPRRVPVEQEPPAPAPRQEEPPPAPSRRYIQPPLVASLNESMAEPDADGAEHLPAYLRGRPKPVATTPEPEPEPPNQPVAPPAPRAMAQRTHPATSPGAMAQRTVVPDEAQENGSAGETLGRMIEGVGKAGQAAAPVVGRAGRIVGTVGRRTLGGVGTLLQHTLPESVRKRGPAAILSPPEDDIDEEYEEYEDEPAYQPPPVAPVSHYSVAEYERPQLPGWLRWLVPLVILVLLGVLAFSVMQILAGQQAAQIDGMLAEAQQIETNANANGDTGQRRQGLLEAQKKVEDALDADPDSAAAQRMARRLQDEIDQLDGVVRLNGLQLLIDLGAPLASTSITATATVSASAPISEDSNDYLSQLLVRGDDVFLLDRGAGKLYDYSLNSKQYNAILSPGDSVTLVGDPAPTTVGDLLFMTWRPTTGGGDLTALDDHYRVYIRDAGKKTWQAFALGGMDENAERPTDFAAYDGNLYLLRGKAGQVSKWAAGAYSSPGVDWLSTQAASEMRSHNPLAMAIDGDIHVLLGSGQVVTLSGGEIKGTITPQVWPPIDSPLAMFAAEQAASIYEVERINKRIIRMSKDSGTTQDQFAAPVGSLAFDNLRNVYVDEQAKRLYILSGKRLYSADLPAAPVVTPAGTPTLKPVQANP